MLIIFDTATKADYYKDVHKVLSAPRDTVVRYDYERRLWSESSQERIDSFSEASKPIPALLVYAQLKSYKKGEADPNFMLNRENAIFIPTRVAEVVNKAYESRAEEPQQNIYVHLRLKGFLSPDTDALRELIERLEDRRELPFGKPNGHKWVTHCPENIDKNALLRESDDLWTAVVDAFASSPSQFSGDVFWRIESVTSQVSLGARHHLKPQQRKDNIFGSIDHWNVGYAVNDTHRYNVAVQNYIPTAEQRELPPHTRVLAKTDQSHIVSLPCRGIELRRNTIVPIRFRVGLITFVGQEDATISVGTEVEGHEGAYPPGSLCELSLVMAKSKKRLLAALGLVLLGGVGLPTGAFLMKQSIVTGIAVFLLSLVFGYLAAWAFTNKIRIWK